MEDSIGRIVSGDLKFKSEDWIKKNLSSLHFFISSKNIGHTFKEKLYCHINSIKSIPRCECGNSLDFISLSKGWRKFCSTKCQSNSQSTIKKRKSTSIQKWGVDNPMKSEKAKGILKNSIQSKWGVDNVSKLQLVKDKVKSTNLEKFGVDHPSKLENFRSMVSSKMNLRSNDLNHLKSKKLELLISDKISDFGLEFVSIQETSIYNLKHLDHQFQIHKNTLNDRIRNGNMICTICNKIESGSDSENQLFNFIRQNYSGDIIQNNRGMIGSEIDILIPDLNLGFEYNGLYWHSDLYKDKRYHLNKTEKCKSVGIKLITIWEDDWKFKKEIVKWRILNLLGESKRIWARRCELREISDLDAKNFLQEYHIQDYCVSKFRFGLFYHDKLVSVMTFGDLRRSLGQNPSDGEYELLRFCNLGGYSVVGGASKLLKGFVSKIRPNKIISYADRSWSSGELYQRLGFSLVKNTDPNYYWVVNEIRRNRFNFRKDILVKEGFDPKKSESEIMKDRGYYRIWDSGSSKWEVIF